MKKVFKVLSVISLLLVIGFSMMSCGDGTTTPVGKEAYYGTWIDTTLGRPICTIVITGNEFKFDGYGTLIKIYFTITKWTAVKNTNDYTKADYPNGYKLDGFINDIKGSYGFRDGAGYGGNWSDVGQTTPIDVFISKDGSTIIWDAFYIKQN